MWSPPARAWVLSPVAIMATQGKGDGRAAVGQGTLRGLCWAPRGAVGGAGAKAAALGYRAIPGGAAAGAVLGGWCCCCAGTARTWGVHGRGCSPQDPHLHMPPSAPHSPIHLLEPPQAQAFVPPSTPRSHSPPASLCGAGPHSCSLWADSAHAERTASPLVPRLCCINALAGGP